MSRLPAAHFAAGVSLSTRLETSSRPGTGGACRTLSFASRKPSFVLCESPQTGVLLPWLRPRRRPGPVSTPAGVMRRVTHAGSHGPPAAGEVTGAHLSLLSMATGAYPGGVGVSGPTRHPGPRRHPAHAHRLCARRLSARLSNAARLPLP